MMSGPGEQRGNGYRTAGIPRWVVWLFGLLHVLHTGCASFNTAPPATGHQTTLGRVAIVSPDREPELSFEGFAHGRAGGAAKGAGSTFLSCLGQLGNGSCSGEFCGAVVILWLGVCGVAGVVGGAVGAVSASPGATVRGAEADLTSAVSTQTIQTALRDRIATVALANGTSLTVVTPPSGQTTDYRLLAPQGIDSVLEVAMTKAGTQGAGINAPVQIYMAAHVRLVRTSDNSEVFAYDFWYQGNRLKLAEWSANQGRPLLQALEDGYTALAAQIYDSVFLLYPFPDQGAHSAGFLAVAFGLAPIEPSLRGQLSGDKLIGPYFEWKTVSSLQPTLRWQRFPRDSDVRAAPAEMGRVKNVRYDLVIAREHELAPAEIVYRRNGLSSPEHHLATPLAPDTGYFWTVRARFELDGRERVTEWGTTDYIVRDRLTSPSRFSYRFKTP
jgi:hypothetical protein